MDVNLLSLCTLAPAALCLVFYAKWDQIYQSTEGLLWMTSFLLVLSFDIIHADKQRWDTQEPTEHTQNTQ